VDACLAFYDFPEKHWKFIHTTNIIECLFGEVKKSAGWGVLNYPVVSVPAGALRKRKLNQACPADKTDGRHQKQSNPKQHDHSTSNIVYRFTCAAQLACFFPGFRHALGWNQSKRNFHA